MARLVFISFIGHVVACVLLVIMSVINPNFRRFNLPRVYSSVYMFEKKAPPEKKTVRPTPTPVKKEQKKTPKPTPKPTQKEIKKKTKTPKPTPKKKVISRKTATPRKTKVRTPTPRPRKPAATPSVRTSTPRPATKTPPQTVSGVMGADVDLPPTYILLAKNKIERNFRFPSHLQRTKKTCTVVFTVTRNGKISNLRFASRSGDTILDKLAVDCLKQTESLGYLPDTVRRSSIDMTVTFDFSR